MQSLLLSTLETRAQWATRKYLTQKNKRIGRKKKGRTKKKWVRAKFMIKKVKVHIICCRGNFSK